MLHRPVPNTGLQVSAIGLGGYLTFGDVIDVDASRAIIHVAFDSGITFFDLADGYANGGAERAVGSCIARPGGGAGGGIPRDKVILSTKVFWPTSDDPNIPPNPNDKGLSRSRILRQIEFSLRNLRTDYLDIYFCHMWDPHTPLEEIVGAMDGLVRVGKVRIWGTSNWPHHGINDACAIAARRHQHAPTLDQPGYNLLDRAIERWLLPAIARRNMSLTTYSPLAGGLLAGGFDQETDVSPHRREQARQRHIGEAAIPRAVEQVRQLSAIAARLNCKASQLAIAWLLSRPFITSVITGASSAAQVRDNAAAADLRLDQNTLREINSIFPPTKLGPRDLLRLLPLLQHPAALRKYFKWRD